MFPLTNKSQRMGRKHACYQNWASRWNRPKLCGLFPQPFAPDSDARCLEQADGSVRKLRKRGEGGSRLLIWTVARPVDGPLVLATQMLTSHCHLFVFGQGSGYWSTCPGESICFTEAILLDLRIVWSWGLGGAGRRMSRRNSVRNGMSFAENSGQFVGECAGSRMVWVMVILRGEGNVLK